MLSTPFLCLWQLCPVALSEGLRQDLPGQYLCLVVGGLTLPILSHSVIHESLPHSVLSCEDESFVTPRQPPNPSYPWEESSGSISFPLTAGEAVI